LVFPRPGADYVAPGKNSFSMAGKGAWSIKPFQHGWKVVWSKSPFKHDWKGARVINKVSFSMSRKRGCKKVNFRKGGN
jgi:hypothetical protein